IGYAFCIAAVEIEWIVEIDSWHGTVNGQAFCCGLPVFPTEYFLHAVNHVFTHLPVGCPLAAEDGEEFSRGNYHLMSPGYLAGLLAAVSGCGQGSESGEHTQHIGSRGSDGKIGRGCFEYEINFLLERGWLERRTVNRSVRGAQYNLLVPGNGKQHSAVACLWNHERVRRRIEFPVNYEVNALAYPDRWRIAG